MGKRKKYLFLCICIITLSVLCLTGCGKGKATGEENYSTDEVTAMKINAAFHMPFVNYSQTVHSFHEDLYKFCEEHPEYEYTRYGETLEANGLKWSTESMEAADVSKLAAKCVIALLIGAVRAERFCDGVLLSFFYSGCILRWLERLKTIDEGGVFNDEQ